MVKKEKGITLVALVITIVILLILAGVTLNATLAENGLFSRAKSVADTYKVAQENEELMLAKLENQLGDLTSNQPTGPKGKPLVKTVTETKHANIEGEDKLGNPVIIPGGFKFAGDENDTVQDGIIIEDDEGNQFVWIPVSNIDGDNNEGNNDEQKEDLIILNDGTEVEITLGRYVFNTNDGTPELRQVGKSYEQVVHISPYFQETLTPINGKRLAKELGAFVTSVEKNHGYYLGRYEASFGSGDVPTTSYGSNGSGTTSIMNGQKPQVKKSTSNNVEKMNYQKGTLWLFITQEDASKVSQNMYSGDDFEAKYIVSDLINSYAWDTAIVYIQKMGNKNYANATGNTGTLTNTGETEDEKCHIYDMAGNVMEWSTEYSNDASWKWIVPCVGRGGNYRLDYKSYVACRTSGNATTSVWNNVGFRPLLYLIDSSNY